MPAAAFDEPRHARAPQMPQGRPDFNPPRPAGKLRGIIGRIAVGGRRGQVFRRNRHGGAQGIGVADDGQSAVVGHVEPFVGIGSP